MKNISLLKKASVILTVLIALILLAQIALTLVPYFTITPLPTLLNPNPEANTYSLFDLCWVDTLTITKYFDQAFKDLSLKPFAINDHVMNVVLTLALGLAMIVCGIVFIKDLVSDYPHTISGTLLQLFSLLWIPIAISGYTGGTILYIDRFVKLDVILPSAHMVRSTSVILIIAASVLVALRLAAWIVTLVLEKKARDERIAAEKAAANA